MLSGRKFMIPLDAYDATDFLGKFCNSLPILSKFLSFEEISKTLISHGIGIREGGFENPLISTAHNTLSFDILVASGNEG